MTTILGSFFTEQYKFIEWSYLHPLNYMHSFLSFQATTTFPSLVLNRLDCSYFLSWGSLWPKIFFKLHPSLLLHLLYRFPSSCNANLHFNVEQTAISSWLFSYNRFYTNIHKLSNLIKTCGIGTSKSWEKLFSFIAIGGYISWIRIKSITELMLYGQYKVMRSQWLLRPCMVLLKQWKNHIIWLMQTLGFDAS